MTSSIASSNETSPARDEAIARLVENSPFGIYIVDADFRMSLISVGAKPAFAGIDALIGRDFAEVLHILWPESFASDAISRFRHTLATGEPYRSSDTFERRQNIDAVESYDWQIDRLTLADGQFAVVCHYYDNTRRMHSEIPLQTQRTQAEAAQARLTAALNGSPAFMGILRGPTHVYEYVNDAVYELVGRRELIGRPLAEAIPEIAGHGYIEMLDGVFVTGKPFIGKGVPAWFARTHGEPPEQRFMDFAYQPLRAADGMVDGIFFHGVDVTDRLEDEQRLRKSKERSLALAAANSDVVYTMSPDWSVMLRLDGHQLVASNDAPITDWMTRSIPPHEYTRVRSAIAAAIARGDRFELEHQVIRPDGDIAWTYSRALPIRDDTGAVVEWFGVASDITDRKRAETSLRESEERFRHAVRAASDILWTNDAQGKMRGEQPGWGAFTAQSHQEYQEYGWSKAIHPDDVQPTILAWEQAVS